MVTLEKTVTSEELRRSYAERNRFRAKTESLYPGQPEVVAEKMREWAEANEMPKSTLEQVADHIDHIRDQIGTDYIGVCGAYDGISSLPLGLEDVSTYAELFAVLLKRCYT